LKKVESTAVAKEMQMVDMMGSHLVGMLAWWLVVLTDLMRVNYSAARRVRSWDIRRVDEKAKRSVGEWAASSAVRSARRRKEGKDGR
jgi:hypothetical protein